MEAVGLILTMLTFGGMLVVMVARSSSQRIGKPHKRPCLLNGGPYETLALLGFGHVRPPLHWSYWAVWRTRQGLWLRARCHRWKTFYVPPRDVQEIQTSLQREHFARTRRA
jgi:hypothetical protein